CTASGLELPKLGAATSRNQENKTHFCTWLGPSEPGADTSKCRKR
ncbi:hypothetical protein A2U01_0089009, partial [Trifolium medium]|nr:hypothetical protein [Trifolium medium]